MTQPPASFPYAVGAGFQAIDLPYLDSTLSMLAVMPSAGTLTPFERHLTAARLARISRSLASTFVKLRMPRFGLIKQMQESKAVIGLNMLTLWKHAGTLGPWIDPLQEMLEDGTIEPVVGGVFGFEEAGAAQSMIVERRNVGKVVLTP